MCSADEYFKRGVVKLAQGDLPGAITEFDKAIELDSDYTEAWSNRGVAKGRQGDLPGAIADFGKAIKLKLDLAEARNNRGNAKYEQGDLPGAIADYDKAIKFKPDYVEAWSNRGVAKEKQGDLRGAIADYDEAIKLKLAQDDLLGAIADLDKVIKLKPDYAEAWLSRGIAKEKQGDLPGAIADYDEAIKLKPDYADAWNNRGIAKEKQGDDLQSAIADYDKAIDLKPDYAEAWDNRGNAKYKQGDDLQSAIADYDKAINLNPDYAEAWGNRGIAKEKQGDLLGAIADYDKAIELKPDLAEAWINRSAVIAVVRDAKKTGVEPKKIWGIFDKARSALDELRESLRKDQLNQPMHYTNLGTLQNLAEGGKFRLYNVKSVDDGEEGNALFDLFDKEHQEKIRKIFSAPRNKDLEVFIGSFATDSNSAYGNDLMWRTFGKHNGEEKAGCALVFDKEKHFPLQPLPLVSLLEARSESFTGKEQNEIVPKKECYLYSVCYVSTDEIQDKVNNLCKFLVQLCNEPYKETREIVAGLLNLVRYLFKDARFQGEQECRIAIVRAGKSPAVKKDPLSTYVECSLNMKEVSVLLGPKVKKAEIWEQWLNDKGSFKGIKRLKL